MRHRLLATAGCALAAVLLLACAGDDDEGPIAIATPSPSGSPTVGPEPDVRGTPAHEVTFTATPEPPLEDLAPAGQPRAGVPLSGSDLVAALERQGLTYVPSQAEIRCAGAATTGVEYRGRGSQRFILWVYPSSEALAREWSVVAGEAPRPLLPGCAGPNDRLYWNNNLLLMFTPEQLASGDDRTREAIVDVFLSIRP